MINYILSFESNGFTQKGFKETYTNNKIYWNCELIVCLKVMFTSFMKPTQLCAQHRYGQCVSPLFSAFMALHPLVQQANGPCLPHQERPLPPPSEIPTICCLLFISSPSSSNSKSQSLQMQLPPIYNKIINIKIKFCKIMKTLPSLS